MSAEAQTSGASNPAGELAGRTSPATVSKHQARAADEAYLAGAKKLGHEDLDGAEHEFRRALELNPDNGTYAVALSVTHERRVNELVQHASKARLAGDEQTAETLLAEARAMDPQNPMVIEHSGEFVRQAASARQGVTGGADAQAPLADRSRMLADAQPSRAGCLDALLDPLGDIALGEGPGSAGSSEVGC